MRSKTHPKYDGVNKSHNITPHLTEDIWQNISSHLSTREWAKAAGTCKTSHMMSLKWARLGQDTPDEGRQIQISYMPCSAARPVIRSDLCLLDSNSLHPNCGNGDYF